MTLDFQTNKRVCEEVAIIPSKSLKNKIAGYATVRCRDRSEWGAGTNHVPQGVEDMALSHRPHCLG